MYYLLYTIDYVRCTRLYTIYHIPYTIYHMLYATLGGHLHLGGFWRLQRALWRAALPHVDTHTHTRALQIHLLILILILILWHAGAIRGRKFRETQV